MSEPYYRGGGWGLFHQRRLPLKRGSEVRWFLVLRDESWGLQEQTGRKGKFPKSVGAVRCIGYKVEEEGGGDHTLLLSRDVHKRLDEEMMVWE